MRKATVQFNKRTEQYELYVDGYGVRYMAYDEDDVYDWAEYNGYDLVEYD